jgi:hypothetical protein
MSLATVLRALHRAGITASPLEIAEALWLAQHLPPATSSQPNVIEEPGILAQQTHPETPVEAAVAPTAPADSVPITTPSPSSEAAPIKSTPVRVPGPPGLTNQRDIQRALRPLRRRVPSRRTQVLDDQATVAYIASTGLWLPVLRSSHERWFDVVLAVDTSASMELWHHLGPALRQVLTQTGAFRDVRIYRLTPGPDGCTFETGAGDTPHSPRELIDGTGRRLFLVLTDGAAEAWHDGRATRTLAAWGANHPVAVVQPLPEAMWSRTGLPAAAVRLTSTTSGAPNSRLGVVYRRHSPGLPVPVPVLGIEPTALAAWAALIAHPATDVALAAAPIDAASAGSPPDVVAASGVDILDRFRATASPAAFRLAVCLSLVPLSLPVMRLVQHVGVPGAPGSALAEVVLGGLMSRTTSGYEFREGIRERLAGELRRSEATAVLSAVSAWIAENAGRASQTFSALLPSEGGVETTAAQFAWVPPAVAVRLGLAVPEAPGTSSPGIAMSAPLTIIAIDTSGTASIKKRPVELVTALRIAFQAAGFAEEVMSPLPWRTAGAAVSVPASVDVGDIVGKVFDYAGSVLWSTTGSADDTFTGIRMAVHTTDPGSDQEDRALARLKEMLKSDVLVAAVGGRGGGRAGLIISDEIHEVLAEAGYGGLYDFRRSALLDEAGTQVWLRAGPIPGTELLGAARVAQQIEAALGPADVVHRQNELDELAAFALGDLPYVWWQGGPWSGKTPLLKAFVTDPPEGVDIVSAFLDETSDRKSFRRTLLHQLRATAPADLEAGFAAAATAAEAQGRSLVLVVDGLDETGQDVTDLLPQEHSGLRVIVSSRTGYTLPATVPLGHPLRRCPVRLLEALETAATPMASGPVRMDSQGTRAVLIGGARPPDRHDIPSTERSIRDLAEVLVQRCGLRRPPRLVLDPTTPEEILETVSAAAAEATELLFLCFAGHGSRGPEGELHLHATGSMRSGQGLSIRRLAAAMTRHLGSTPVLILLDCADAGAASFVPLHRWQLIGSDRLPSRLPTSGGAGAARTRFIDAFVEILKTSEQGSTADDAYRRVVTRAEELGLPHPYRSVHNQVSIVLTTAEPAHRADSRVPVGASLLLAERLELAPAGSPRRGWGDVGPELDRILRDVPFSTGDVLNTLTAIQRIFDLSRFTGGNRVAAFNSLYFTLTDRLAQALRGADVHDVGFLELLDVELARRYFDALRSWGEDDPVTPDAWEVLFRRAEAPETTRLTAAMLGANAQVNHDLALALVATWQRLGPPETEVVHPDYLLINKIFYEEIPGLRNEFSGRLASRIDGVGDQLEDASRRALVAASRGNAWDQARRLWMLRDDPQDFDQAMLLMDRAAAYCGEIILLGDDSFLRRVRGGLSRATEFLIGPRDTDGRPA